MQQSNLSQLTPLAMYREQRELIFASKHSLDWYVRRHRNDLIEGGALLLVAGRWFADAERFDAYVMAQGAATAKAHLGCSDPLADGERRASNDAG